MEAFTSTGLTPEVYIMATQKYFPLLIFLLLLKSVLRIRIRLDPYHLGGSTSGNFDPDPSSKKIVINKHKN